jgi:hypothetical protein
MVGRVPPCKGLSVPLRGVKDARGTARLFLAYKTLAHWVSVARVSRNCRVSTNIAPLNLALLSTAVSLSLSLRGPLFVVKLVRFGQYLTAWLRVQSDVPQTPARTRYPSS